MLTKADEARKANEKAKIMDNIQLAEMASRIDGTGNIDLDVLKQELDRSLGEGNYELKGIPSNDNPTDGWGVYIDEELYYTINGKVTGSGGGSEEEIPPEVLTLTGKGTEAEPYKIANENDMEYLAQEVNSGKNMSNTYFNIESDLDFDGHNMESIRKRRKFI